MALERADMIHPGNGAPEELGQNKPVLLRASVPESHTVYEVVARMETVGGVFSRTMVCWLLLDHPEASINLCFDVLLPVHDRLHVWWLSHVSSIAV